VPGRRDEGIALFPRQVRVADAALPLPSITWKIPLEVRRSAGVRSPGRSQWASAPIVGMGAAPLVGST
jgi:hypothetical protein